MTTRTKRAHLAWWLVIVAWVCLMVTGLTGCFGKSEGRAAAAESTASVDALNARTYVVAQHGPCVVFYTKTALGPDVNWVRCFGTEGEAATYTQTTRSCDKNCTKRVTVVTLAQ